MSNKKAMRMGGYMSSSPPGKLSFPAAFLSPLSLSFFSTPFLFSFFLPHFLFISHITPFFYRILTPSCLFLTFFISFIFIQHTFHVTPNSKFNQLTLKNGINLFIYFPENMHSCSIPTHCLLLASCKHHHLPSLHIIIIHHFI